MKNAGTPGMRGSWLEKFRARLPQNNDGAALPEGVTAVNRITGRDAQASTPVAPEQSAPGPMAKRRKPGLASQLGVNV